MEAIQKAGNVNVPPGSLSCVPWAPRPNIDQQRREQARLAATTSSHSTETAAGNCRDRRVGASPAAAVAAEVDSKEQRRRRKEWAELNDEQDLEGFLKARPVRKPQLEAKGLLKVTPAPVASAAHKVPVKISISTVDRTSSAPGEMESEKSTLDKVEEILSDPVAKLNWDSQELLHEAPAPREKIRQKAHKANSSDEDNDVDEEEELRRSKREEKRKRDEWRRKWKEEKRRKEEEEKRRREEEMEEEERAIQSDGEAEASHKKRRRSSHHASESADSSGSSSRRGKSRRKPKGQHVRRSTPILSGRAQAASLRGLSGQVTDRDLDRCLRSLQNAESGGGRLMSEEEVLAKLRKGKLKGAR